MTKPYTQKTWARSLHKAGIAALLASGTALGTQAQTLNYTATTAANVAGTYTDIAGTTGNTAIVTANTDDANSAATPIGFTFTFNGTAFTEFVLNTNGLLRLGSAGPSSAAAFPPYAQTPEAGPISGTNAADVNLIAPFNLDLGPGTAAGTEYRVVTTGTAPNRVCTIQWKNVADKPQAPTATIASIVATQYANFSFQAKLYETTNAVEFVYGAATAGTGTDEPKYAAVGIKGSTPTASLLATKGSVAQWSTAVFGPGPYPDRLTGNGHNIRRTTLPDAGRIYRFAPTPGNDAAVTAVYTLGKIASPGALPHAVQAVITNLGVAAQANLDVTLNVTGANSFTDTKRIPSLPAGAVATVTFANYPGTLTPGLNTVTVTVPADANAANNSASYGQLVTTNRISYTDPTVTSTLGVGLGNSVFASKYTLPAATVLSDVVVTFAPATGTAVNTAPYQVVIYDASAPGGLPGRVLYTSATQNRTSAGGAATVAVPNVAVPAAFFIGVKETSAANVAVAYQVESTIRPATFYYTIDGATWTDFVLVTPKARFSIEFGTIVPNCAAPTALAVSNVSATGATVTFTPLSTGAASYELIYGPTGFNPLTAGTTIPMATSPVTLTGLNPATIYQVYVRSICTAGGTSSFAPVLSFATLCNPNPAVSTFPYTLNFDTVLPGQTLPCGVSVLNANNDAVTWAVSNVNPSSGSNSMRYRGLVLNNVTANDWFFTPPLTLLGTSRYQVAFRYRGEGISNSPSNYTESLEVKSGTAPTVAAQTNLLFTNNAITNTNYALANGTSMPVVALLPLGAGTQYVGFHVFSAANQGNLYIDDISVTATAISSTSEALMRAVSVFPNPSATGVFDLEIHGANAPARLGVEVINALGQRVYTGSARDNYTNRLDLSSLAPGIYYLQVRNGDERLTSQLSIVK